jgi:hypothetical protein
MSTPSPHALRRLRSAFLLIALAATLPSLSRAGDPVFVWPGSGACAGTLQACIDAASVGAIVEIDSNAEIDEALVIPNSRTLRAAPGRRPSLAPGRSIVGSFSGVSAAFVNVHGLRLRDGHIRLTHSGTGAAGFEVTDCVIESSGPNVPAGIRIELPTDTTASRQIAIARNQLHVGAPGLLDAGIYVRVEAGPASIDIRHNRVRARGETAGYGIYLDSSFGADVSADVFANEVGGSFGSALALTEGRFSSTAATLSARVVSNVLIGGGNFRGGGLQLTVGNGSMPLTALNNTVVFGRGVVISRWGGSGPRTGSVTGQIQNNLIAYTRFGLQNSPDIGGSASNDYNLKWQNNPAGLHTAGANDINADPRLRTPLAPRLTAGSPAINAGNGFALLLAPQLADTDGDGLRRIVGVVDIGAYEYGHRAFSHRKTASTSTPDTPVTDPEVAFDSARRLFVTQNFRAGLVVNPHPVGVSFFDQWFVVNSDGANMPQNAHHNVFVPLGSSSNGVFQHTASGGNTLDDLTQVDWTTVNGDPGWIILATQSTNFGTPFETAATVLDYSGTRWTLRTADASGFNTNTRWNLYAQRPSPQAFLHTVAISNQPAGSSATYLDHPLLNGTPCAQIQVSALARSGGGAVFDLDYDVARGQHRIFSNSGAIPVGARYHVLVNPGQIDECSGGPLFFDGFEGFGF